MSSLPTESIDDLFQPNNHSNWIMEYVNVEPEVSSRVYRLVNTHYHLSARHVLSIQQFKGTEISSHNYKVKIKNQEGNIGYILIRSHKEFDSEFVKGVIGACDYLSIRRCSVPEVIPNDSGRCITNFEGERYTAYKFIEGTHYQGNIGELISVASKLAQLDQHLLGMERIIDTD